LDLVQQMAKAVLDGAGGLVVASVAIHDETAGQPELAENLLGDSGRPGLTEQ
jgi:hypothetical protein